jgi:hypothetical protein
MSVTAKGAPDTAGISRNAAVEAEVVHVVRQEINSPDREMLEKYFGPRTDEQIAAHAGARFLKDAAYRCDRCEHVFQTGDVAYRRRMQLEPDIMSHWKLMSVCEECVQGWHPSWWKHRRAPVPCLGGCGVLVADWHRWQRVTTCSKRCSKLVARVQHDEQACEVCDEMFVPKRADARYCSGACRQDAYRRRKAGEAA